MFSNDLRANVMKWLKSADIYGDHDKVIETWYWNSFIAVFRRFWLQSKSDVDSLERVGELAGEFPARRKANGSTFEGVLFEPQSQQDTYKWSNGRSCQGDQGENKSPKKIVECDVRCAI